MFKDRFKDWVNRNIVDDCPYDDEMHAATRYRIQLEEEERYKVSDVLQGVPN